MDHHPAASQPLGQTAGIQDVFFVLFQLDLVNGRQADEIRGVHRDLDAVLCRLGADLPGRGLSHIDAPAALIFIEIHTQLPQVTGGIHAGFIFGGKGVAVAGGAEQCAHLRTSL